MHGVEQQLCSIQVVERVGLIASGFQFFTRLAAVFAEEVGGFGNLTALHFIFFRRHLVIGESRIAGQSSMSVR